jgi:glycosyltransferase involved in cell wall biosynthesis
MNRQADRPRVLALLHLPPPVHGLSLKNERMLEGLVPEQLELTVIRYRFARELSELQRVTARKLALALVYLVRQVVRLGLGRVDAGYITLATVGGGLYRDAIYMHAFRLFGVPYAVHVPSMGLPDRIRREAGPGGRLVRSALEHASAVIALNDLHARELEELVPRRRIATVPNALPDLEVRTPSPGEGDRPLILFLSNLAPEKGPFVLLEALPSILRRVPGARACFAGAWHSREDGARFGARVRELGVAAAVTVRGPVDEEEKRSLLAAAGVLVFPSHHPTECSPNVVLEGMRQGLPMVATRHGGVPELIEDGVSGILVPPGYPGPLADAVVEVLTQPRRAGALGQAARRRFDAGHLQDRWDRQIIDLMRAVASGGPLPDQRVAVSEPDHRAVVEAHEPV